MGRIAGSINQMAKRCNENKSVHTNDVEQLRREFLELKADYLERVVKLLRKIYLLLPERGYRVWQKKRGQTALSF